MNYVDFISDIIIDRGQHADLEIKEKHHILPRCLGGPDDESNLINLTPAEHYTAHKLLALENPTHSGLTYAWWMMSRVDNKEITAEEYEFLKSNLHPSEEARAKISKTQKGKKLSEEARKKISEANKGRKRSEETRQKLSEAHKGQESWMKGKQHTEESKEKNRLAHLGKKTQPCSEDTKNKIAESLKNSSKSNKGKHRVYREDGTFYLE